MDGQVRTTRVSGWAQGPTLADWVLGSKYDGQLEDWSYPLTQVVLTGTFFCARGLTLH